MGLRVVPIRWCLVLEFSDLASLRYFVTYYTGRKTGADFFGVTSYKYEREHEPDSLWRSIYMAEERRPFVFIISAQGTLPTAVPSFAGLIRAAVFDCSPDRWWDNRFNELSHFSPILVYPVGQPAGGGSGKSCICPGPIFLLDDWLFF